MINALDFHICHNIRNVTKWKKEREQKYDSLTF